MAGGQDVAHMQAIRMASPACAHTSTLLRSFWFSFSRSRSLRPLSPSLFLSLSCARTLSLSHTHTHTHGKKTGKTNDAERKITSSHQKRGGRKGKKTKQNKINNNITPVTGLIFEAKIERYFLESFFRERNFGRSITCLQLCSQ